MGQFFFWNFDIGPIVKVVHNHEYKNPLRGITLHVKQYICIIKLNKQLTQSISPQPIYLRVLLQSDRGTLQCCGPPSPCTLCARAALPSTLCLLPHHAATPPRRLLTDPDLYANKKIKLPDISVSHPDKFTEQLRRTRTGSLNETMLRIPQVQVTSADFSSFDGVFVNDVDNTLLCVRKCVDPYTPESIDSHSPNVEASSGSEVSVEVAISTSKSTKLSRDRSVSPTQLKSRLDKLLSDKDDKRGIRLGRVNSRSSCKSEGSKVGALCCLALKCYGLCRRSERSHVRL